MITFTSAEAQNRFGELLDRSQREPVQVTRRGRPVAYVVSEHDMRELQALSERRVALQVRALAVGARRHAPVANQYLWSGYTRSIKGGAAPRADARCWATTC